MNYLKETIQKDSEVASFIRSNIPFIAQMISEQRLGIGGRVARFGQELGYRGLGAVSRFAQRSLQNRIDYQQNVADKWEEAKTAERVGISPSQVRTTRQNFARLGGKRPMAPRAGASVADVARYDADMEAFNLGTSLERRTAAERAKDTNYRNTVSTLERLTSKGKDQLAGKQSTLLGRAYTLAQKTEKEAKARADALKQARQTDVARERTAARNVIRARGQDPDSLYNRVKTGLFTPRI
jgi:hypothetical protein